MQTWQMMMQIIIMRRLKCILQKNFAFTQTWYNGIFWDNKDQQGKWKQRHITDTNDDVEFSCVDAKMAAVLCPLGACDHVVQNAACTQQSICANIASSIKEAARE